MEVLLLVLVGTALEVVVVQEPLEEMEVEVDLRVSKQPVLEEQV
tara:strand:+ start:141 stop:272 length:132 start_codon:yes stop_codon:yes gene_type:complete